MENKIIFKDPGKHGLEWRAGDRPNEWLATTGATGYRAHLIRFVDNGRVLFHLNYWGGPGGFRCNDFDFYQDETAPGLGLSVAKEDAEEDLTLLMLATTYFYMLVAMEGLDPLNAVGATIYNDEKQGYTL